MGKQVVNIKTAFNVCYKRFSQFEMRASLPLKRVLRERHILTIYLHQHYYFSSAGYIAKTVYSRIYNDKKMVVLEFF